jgi:hypothetical protein
LGCRTGSPDIGPVPVKNGTSDSVTFLKIAIKDKGGNPILGTFSKSQPADKKEFHLADGSAPLWGFPLRPLLKEKCANVFNSIMKGTSWGSRTIIYFSFQRDKPLNLKEWLSS